MPSVLGEGSDDDAPLGFKGLRHGGQVPASVFGVGEEVEYGPVVPQPEMPRGPPGKDIVLDEGHLRLVFQPASNPFESYL